MSDSILITPSSPWISHISAFRPGVLLYPCRHTIVAIAPDLSRPEKEKWSGDKAGRVSPVGVLSGPRTVAVG